MDSQKMKQLILKGIKGLIRPIIIITIIIILLVSLFFGVIDGIYENVAKIFNDIVDNINIEGNNIVIDEEYMENAKSRLERLGINSSTLGLGNDEKYLERYLVEKSGTDRIKRCITSILTINRDMLNDCLNGHQENRSETAKQLIDIQNTLYHISGQYKFDIEF